MLSWLPALDALVPQMVDQLEDVLQIVDLFVPAQEIEVPQDLQPSPSSSSSGSSCPADGGTVDERAIAGVDAACAVDAVHRGLRDPGGHQAHPEDPPDRFTASSGWYINTGQG